MLRVIAEYVFAADVSMMVAQALFMHALPTLHELPSLAYNIAGDLGVHPLPVLGRHRPASESALWGWAAASGKASCCLQHRASDRQGTCRDFAA